MSGCSKDPDGANGSQASLATEPTFTGATASDSEADGSESTTAGESSTSEGDSTTSSSTTTDPIPDLPPVQSGCIALDMLFVVDNSASMGIYQDELANAFPTFIDSLWDVLPDDVDVHVGITTTDFAGGCDTPEATLDCQSTAAVDQIVQHYIKPNDSIGNGTQGSQGRLFPYDNKLFFEAVTPDDNTALKTWFGDAARAAGEDGCTFEMPVAAAGWAANPVNTGSTGTNNGFFRDEGALLFIFFLTDEPDKSPEYNVHVQSLIDLKSNCGGEQCIFMSGLIPSCAYDINQKLWQYMNEWNPSEEAPWADIVETNMYPELVGSLLADTLADVCMQIPPVD